jgi:hypothetical protein
MAMGIRGRGRWSEWFIVAQKAMNGRRNIAGKGEMLGVLTEAVVARINRTDGCSDSYRQAPNQSKSIVINLLMRFSTRTD